MTGWLSQLDTRELGLLFAGAAIVLAIAVAGLVWWPLQQQRTDLAQRIESQSETLVWMQVARARVLEAREMRPADQEQADSGPSLLSLIDTGVRAQELASHLRRAEPAGDGGVRLWLEGAPFSTLAHWLESLETRHGVTVAEMRLERAGNGSVDARLLLDRGVR